MYLIYFDENKYSKENPFFYIGGILLKDDKLTDLESTIMQIQFNYFSTNILTKDTELHGISIFQGKDNFKTRKLEERVRLFNDITTFVIDNKIPIRMVRIDIEAHRKKYKYPQPEYNLGLTLVLERFCDFLENVNDIGVVFGDYEGDEISKSILDFSQFKHIGKTPMYHGRALGRLKDTIYFSHSHHSRFLQITDILVYMAGRFENNGINPSTFKWHETQVYENWEKIKVGTDFKIQRWP
jgi:hypothetical protein